VTEPNAHESRKLSWRFPATFWFANGAELCERAAFYGMFITLFRYLNEAVGFSDVQTGWITGAFASILYFLPTFMGIMADKIGFRRALVIAFALLTAGYGLLGAFQLKSTALTSLALIMFGGAIIKPVISGTVAKCSDDAHRARAMSIFYMVVNIGSFSGKGLAGQLNEVLGLQYINFYASGMSFTALLLVALFYRNVDTAGTGKTIREALGGLVRVMANARFLCLILIIGGFWAIQGQLYSSMPTYIERLLGKGYKPEWLANINPLIVVIFVVPITNLVRDFRPASAISIGLGIIPLTALVIAIGPALEGVLGSGVAIGAFTLHPLVLVFIVGIALQGFAECFLSPKWLEYVSKQAPKGEIGLYLGYSHLTTFFAWLFGFILAGYLLQGYCPDPKTFSPEVRNEWRQATDPEYLFTLSEERLSDLDVGGPVSPALRADFVAHGIELAPDASVHLEPLRDRWRANPERDWTLASGGHEYKLHENRFEASRDGRSVQVVEVVVHADTARPRETLPALPSVYDHAHYIWFVFTGIGVVAFLAMLIFRAVTDSLDRKRGAAGRA
jgi:dipeptide/tripeptide permease